MAFKTRTISGKLRFFTFWRRLYHVAFDEPQGHVFKHPPTTQKIVNAFFFCCEIFYQGDLQNATCVVNALCIKYTCNTLLSTTKL